MIKRKFKILVIDDDKEIREFLSLILKDANWQVSFAPTGKEALRMAEEIKPHLIILDIYMPELDGFQVLKHLRDQKSTRKTPVIMLTAAEKEANMDKAYIKGADAYINKPIDIPQLYRKIEKFLTCSSN